MHGRVISWTTPSPVAQCMEVVASSQCCWSQTNLDFAAHSAGKKQGHNTDNEIAFQRQNPRKESVTTLSFSYNLRSIFSCRGCADLASAVLPTCRFWAERILQAFQYWWRSVVRPTSSEKPENIKCQAFFLHGTVPCKQTSFASQQSNLSSWRFCMFQQIHYQRTVFMGWTDAMLRLLVRKACDAQVLASPDVDFRRLRLAGCPSVTGPDGAIKPGANTVKSWETPGVCTWKCQHCHAEKPMARQQILFGEQQTLTKRVSSSNLQWHSLYLLTIPLEVQFCWRLFSPNKFAFLNSDTTVGRDTKWKYRQSCRGKPNNSIKICCNLKTNRTLNHRKCRTVLTQRERMGGLSGSQCTGVGWRLGGVCGIARSTKLMRPLQPQRFHKSQWWATYRFLEGWLQDIPVREN